MLGTLPIATQGEQVDFMDPNSDQLAVAVGDVSRGVERAESPMSAGYSPVLTTVVNVCGVSGKARRRWNMNTEVG